MAREVSLVIDSYLFFRTGDLKLDFLTPHFNTKNGHRQPRTAPRFILLIRRSVDREWSGHVGGRIDFG